jgi:hypothetical protein
VTPGTEVDRVIVMIDLRTENPADVLSGPFYEFQAKRGPGGGQQVDFGRVILVDHAGQLTAHDEIYAHVLDSHIDVSMICVAIGPPPAADPTVAIRRPFQLGLQKAAVLWVGDLDGVGWRMDSTLASQVNLPANGTAPDPKRLPAELLEILSVRQVFDEVLALVGGMPGNVASPGVRTIRGDIPADILTIAQRSAIKQLTKESGGVTGFPPLGKLEDIPSPAENRPGRAIDVIRPGGRVDELTQKAKRSGHSAVMLMGRVTGLAALTGTHSGIRPALKVFADALEELRGAAAWGLDEADTHSGFDSRHRQNLDEIGIDLTKPPAGTVEHLTAALTEQALEAVGKCQPLPAIVDRLQNEAESAAPRGTAQYRARLQRIASDGFLGALRTPPAFISGWPSATALMTAFVTCLICGAWPRPYGLYGGIAAIGAVLIGIWLLARGAGISPGTGANGRRFLGGHIAASVLGAGCGVALSKAVPSPSRFPAGVGAAVTVVMLVILILVSWRVLARRWVRAVQVTKVATTPDLIRQLMADAAREEWQLAAARTTVSNHAKGLAGMLAAAAAAMRDQEAKLTPAAGPAQSGLRRPSAHDQLSQELVVTDLAAGIASALGRLIATPGPNGLAAIDTAMARREVADMLDEYRRHLLTASLHEPPPFGRPPERRAELVQSLVERGSDLQNAVRFTVADERINQLCAPPQLTLLETRPDKAELIRFAPHSAQGFIDQRIVGRERPVNWTWSSAIAGVLRLVSLRPGAIEEVIAQAPAGPTGTPNTSASASPPTTPNPVMTPPRPAGGS